MGPTCPLARLRFLVGAYGERLRDGERDADPPCVRRPADGRPLRRGLFGGGAQARGNKGYSLTRCRSDERRIGEHPRAFGSLGSPVRTNDSRHPDMGLSATGFPSAHPIDERFRAAETRIDNLLTPASNPLKRQDHPPLSTVDRSQVLIPPHRHRPTRRGEPHLQPLRRDPIAGGHIRRRPGRAVLPPSTHHLPQLSPPPASYRVRPSWKKFWVAPSS